MNSMRWIAVGAVIALGLTAVATEWPEGADPAAVSAKLADQLLSTAPEQYRPKGYRGYVYEQGGKWVNYAVWSLWAPPLANDPKPPYNATPLAERQKWFAQGYTDQTRFWIDDMYMIAFMQLAHSHDLMELRLVRHQ